MPITRQAAKKLRHDRVRTVQNKKSRTNLDRLLKKARKSPTPATVSKAASAIDKAAQHKSIHRNKAARLKSRLAKKLQKK